MKEESTQLFSKSGGKLLTFMTGSQEYGIEILEAREVVGLMEIDPIPQTPDFMKGVINLRGKIIPVIDLRSKFNMEETEATSESCIIVVNVQERITGIIVDSLVGVLTIEKKDFEEDIDFGTNINTDFIAGIAKLDRRVIIVLAVENILSNEDLVLVQVDENNISAGDNNA